MTLNTRYITLEEFFEYTGLDLRQRIKKDDNPSRTAEAFLQRVADRMEAYIEANYHRVIDREYPNFTNYQKRKYKLALIEQALYTFQNGDISVDSGYDPEKGIVASKHALSEIALAPNAKNYLLLCGVLTRAVKTKGRSGFLDGIWWY